MNYEAVKNRAPSKLMAKSLVECYHAQAKYGGEMFDWQDIPKVRIVDLCRRDMINTIFFERGTPDWKCFHFITGKGLRYIRDNNLLTKTDTSCTPETME